MSVLKNKYAILARTKMFKKWCYDQGFSHGRQISHVLMDGGVLSIPFDRLYDFYKVYVQCIKTGEKIYVVEQKTELYNFFLDIDYKDDDPLGLDQVRAISDVICNKIESLHSGTKCIISVSKPKPKDGQIKTGIHMNWPGLVVSQNEAIQLMKHVISTLEKIYTAHDWTKSIDPCVYGDPETGSKGSGFRLPWSHKRSKHAECMGKGCMVCNNTGRLTEGEYLPIFMFTDSSMHDTDQDPTLEKLMMATVRCTDTEINCSIIPEPRKKKPKKKEGDFTASQVANEFHDAELNALLETFIRQNMDGQEKSRVLKVFKHKDAFLVKTDSKWCENLKRAHNSNHIWFLITPDSKIKQKCFCRCETTQGRRHGFCKDFSGREHILSKRIIEILFPNRKKNAYISSRSTGVRNRCTAYS